MRGIFAIKFRSQRPTVPCMTDQSITRFLASDGIDIDPGETAE